MVVLKSIKKNRLIPVLFLIGFLSHQNMGAQKLLEELFNGRVTKHNFTEKGEQFTLFQYSVDKPLSVASGMQLFFIKIPLDQVDINIKEINQNVTSQLSFEEKSNEKTIVMVGGGFYRNNEKGFAEPDGLLIVDNEIKSKYNDSNEGGFLFKKQDSISIVAFLAFEDLHIEEGIQSNVLLVKNGKNDMPNDDHIYDRRLCIGITKNKELLVCGVFNEFGRKVSLFEFAEILTYKNAKVIPNTEVALNLDGGPNARFYVPNLKLHIGDMPTAYITNLIEITLKDGEKEKKESGKN